jgi:hypothetical protein
MISAPFDCGADTFLLSFPFGNLPLNEFDKGARPGARLASRRED